MNEQSKIIIIVVFQIFMYYSLYNLLMLSLFLWTTYLQKLIIVNYVCTYTYTHKSWTLLSIPGINLISRENFGKFSLSQLMEFIAKTITCPKVNNRDLFFS